MPRQNASLIMQPLIKLPHRIYVLKFMINKLFFDFFHIESPTMIFCFGL